MEQVGQYYLKGTAVSFVLDDDHAEDPGVDEVLHAVADGVDRVVAAGAGGGEAAARARHGQLHDRK